MVLRRAFRCLCEVGGDFAPAARGVGDRPTRRSSGRCGGGGDGCGQDGPAGRLGKARHLRETPSDPEGTVQTHGCSPTMDAGEGLLPAPRASPRPPILVDTTGMLRGLAPRCSIHVCTPPPRPWTPSSTPSPHGCGGCLPPADRSGWSASTGTCGSGKSTFAGRLADALGGAPVLHLDDIATHEELFAWTERLLDQVIEPLRHGRSARYAPYDWRARGYGAARVLPCGVRDRRRGVGASGAHCADIWRGWCGWSCRRRRPGRVGRRGTERSRASSGQAGSGRSVGISPRILLGPSPIC